MIERKELTYVNLVKKRIAGREHASKRERGSRDLHRGRRKNLNQKLKNLQ